MNSNISNKPRVLFLLPVVGQPRHSKRIDMLISSGLHVEILAFERDYPLGRKPSIPITVIGHIKRGHYFRRMAAFFWALKPIRKRAKQNDIVYCFGHDLAALAILSKIGCRVKVALEVGDIQDIQMRNNVIGSIMRVFDRILMRRIDLLILISEGFKDFYSRKLGYKKNYLIIENKVEKSSIFINSNYSKGFKELKPLTSPLKIGYFGVLRDRWGWSVLKQLATRFPDKYQIVLAGKIYGLDDFEESIKNFDNIQYLGEYSSPSGLPYIYSKVDMMWICYAPIKAHDINLLAGRPNRFYESCYFGKPVFGRQSVSFSKDVEKYGIGHCINSNSEEGAINEILKISFQNIKYWQNQMKLLPKNVYIETDESNTLFTALNQLVQ
jgi:succinoglycan biosynthesis protein ExoL